MKLTLKTLLAAVLISATPAMAGDDVKTMEAEAAFGDIAQGVSDAIVNRGYKIDYHGFIGEMLKRTAGDVGASKEVYKNAEFFTFCSAVLSRKVMEEDAGGIAYCPYVVFVYENAETPGKITVGYRMLPAGGARDEVNSLLGSIVEEAVQ